MAAVIRNRFYPLIGIALSVLIVLGFARTYYLRFLYHMPPLKLLVQLHGLVFTAWLVLFLGVICLGLLNYLGVYVKSRWTDL